MAGNRSMKFDAIIVGSGFGGSVCAARLAEKGMRVLVLERGPWWGPLQRGRPPADHRELPRGPAGIRRLLRNLRTARRGRRLEKLFYADGLIEIHRFEHLHTVAGSGVGGGSHIYTNILDEPEADFFHAFPPEITGDEMHPHFERVRAMLRPAPVPDPPGKERVFAEALRAAGLPPPEYPDLAIAWGADPQRPEKVTNAAGVEQGTSTYLGDAIVGSDDGSKTTLDLTYVPVALRHGAELRPLCEVLAVGADDAGYWVRYRDHRSGEQLRESAQRLVLAAGALNTQRLLFDARDGHGALPNLPATLGSRFSANGDFGALLFKTAMLADSAYGPTIGAQAKVRENGIYRYVIAETGIPVHALPLPELARRWLRRSTLLVCMGRSASDGRTGFDGKGLITSLDRSLDAALYGEMEDAVRRTAAYYRPRALFVNSFGGSGPQGIFTVHPLGGCPIGRSPEDGFTDHRGRVFGHPGLYVADGSLYPKSPGIAPSMTIAALAERMAALMQ